MIKKEDRKKAQQEFRAIVTHLARDSIYTKFKNKVRAEGKTVKGVLIGFIKEYLYGKDWA